MVVLNLYYQLNIRKYAKVIHSHYKSLNQLDLFHSLLQDKLIEYDDLFIIKESRIYKENKVDSKNHLLLDLMIQ